MPRPAEVLVWTLGAVAMHAVVPFELSVLGGRAGPPASRFAAQGTGLVTVAAGAGLMAWALAAHWDAAPRGWTLESGLTPSYLLRRGPYRLCRNPMYAGEAVVWLGWALVYSRPAVWAGLAIECAAFKGIARWEEQQLLARFRRLVPGLPGGRAPMAAAAQPRRRPPASRVQHMTLADPDLSGGCVRPACRDPGRAKLGRPDDDECSGSYRRH